MAALIIGGMQVALLAQAGETLARIRCAETLSGQGVDAAVAFQVLNDLSLHADLMLGSGHILGVGAWYEGFAEKTVAEANDDGVYDATSAFATPAPPQTLQTTTVTVQCCLR